MSRQQNGRVAHILISPRVFERQMSAVECEAVDRLVQSFHDLMSGHRLVVAAQAIGQLTADYVHQIGDRGGDGVLALQDIASRGEEWISAGDAAKRVVEKARARMLPRRGSRRKVD